MHRLFDKILHSAWEPFTPRGVVAFARASVSRLLLVHLFMAMAGAITVGWFVSTAWLPVVDEAIQHLPANGVVSHAELRWRGDTPERLAANAFLSFAVDIWHDGGLSREAQIAVEFASKAIRVHSLLGYVEFPYPQGWVIPASEPVLEPWWNSRSPWLLSALAVGTLLYLMLSWLLLATLYSLPVWLLAFYTNRHLSWPGSWKIAGAALMPGALFMMLSIIGYGLGLFGLIQLGLATAFHFIIGWIYLLVSPLLLPRNPAVAKPAGNPFAGS